MSNNKECLSAGETYISDLSAEINIAEVTEYLTNVLRALPLYVEYYSYKSEHRTAATLVSTDGKNGVDPAKRYELYDPIIQKMADLQDGVITYVELELKTHAARVIHAYVKLNEKSVDVSSYPDNYPFVFHKTPLPIIK